MIQTKQAQNTSWLLNPENCKGLSGNLFCPQDKWMQQLMICGSYKVSIVIEPSQGQV